MAVLGHHTAVNMIDEGTFRAIKRYNPSIALKQSSAKIYPYGTAKPPAVLGQFSA